jgi:hypothetical protein
MAAFAGRVHPAAPASNPGLEIKTGSVRAFWVSTAPVESASNNGKSSLKCRVTDTHLLLAPRRFLDAARVKKVVIMFLFF